MAVCMSVDIAIVEFVDAAIDAIMDVDLIAHLVVESRRTLGCAAVLTRVLVVDLNLRPILYLSLALRPAWLCS